MIMNRFWKAALNALLGKEGMCCLPIAQIA